MTEPRRWLDPDSDARAFEREVLELAKPVSIPEASAERIWQRVSAITQGPPGGGAGGAGTNAAGATTAGAAGVIKLFAAGVLAGLALTGGGYAAFVDAPRAAPAPISRVPLPLAEVAATATASVVMPEAPASERDVPGARTTQTPRRVTPASTPSAVRLEAERRFQAAFPLEGSSVPSELESQLKEEAALIREARARLRAGDLAGAFATLEAARTRFPRPVLVEEREALTIELLAQSGRLESARERARAFLSQFPESSLRQRMQQLSEGTRGR